MLAKFRTKHVKNIFRICVIIIIVVFAFWGGSSFLNKRKEEIIGEIDKQKITLSQFNYYRQMAVMYLSLFMNTEGKISSQDVTGKAIEYLLFTWKAEKEKIKVEDKEVVARINSLLFPKDNFNKEIYEHFLINLKRRFNIDPVTFESYIRDEMRHTKLLERYVQLDIRDKEVRDLYKIDTQKAKITYIKVPYKNFEDRVKITEKELQTFYEQNNLLFKEEPKVKIKYVIIDDKKDDFSKIMKELPTIHNMAELNKKFALEVKESDFMGINDSIEGLDENNINQFAFSLKNNQLSPPISTSKGVVIMEKIGEKESFIPALEEIKERVRGKLKEKIAQEEVRKTAKNILKKITQKRIKDIKKIYSGKYIVSYETDYFKYYENLTDFSFDEKSRDAIFSSKKGEIYPKLFTLPQGVYIIQLNDITLFNEKEFEEKKDIYKTYLKQQRMFLERWKLYLQLQKEANLKIYYL